MSQLVFAPREGIPPLDPDAMVFEMDVDLILRVDREPRPVRETTAQLIEAMQEPARHRPGTVLHEGEDPLVLLALVHDLDAQPSCREAWVRDAYDRVLKVCGAREIQRLALPLLGTVHGRLDAERSQALLETALADAPRPPAAVWIMGS